jgi:hypothetical protein
VLDRRGKIAGVVYAIELSTEFGLAIPVDTLRRQPPPPQRGLLPLDPNPRWRIPV